MSFWDNFTKPINKALDSNTFKGMFPVQALAQKGVQLGSGLTGIRGGEGLRPADQYAIGGGIGSLLGGGSALAGASGGAGGAGGTAGTGGAGSSVPSGISNFLRLMRTGQQQPMQQPQDKLEQFYAMYPSLRPRFGGTNGIR